MRVLFARVGFMEYYQGPQPGDEQPNGGGAYNAIEVGHEAYNFMNINGTLYRFFQPHQRGNPPYNIKLNRIEQGCVADTIDEVLVIWFATDPENRGQVVVGWYKNATVFKSMQTPNALPLRNNYGYYVKADTENCVLLKREHRRFRVGCGIQGNRPGQPGRTNVFYVLKDNGQKKDFNVPDNAWIPKLIDDIINYQCPNISLKEDKILEDILTTIDSSGGQGFQSNVKVRRTIESHAMKICQKHYEDLHYKVEDVSDKKPYDFIITQNGQTRFVEVKGTQTAGDTIFLTKNEVEQSQMANNSMVLFIVHSISLNGEEIQPESGVVSIIDPWQANADRLTPITYSYRLNP